MPTPAELLAQSLAKFQTANRIDGNKNSYRKDNPSEYTVVVAYLKGGTRPTSVTSDMGLGLVLEEDARRALLAGPTGATGPGPTGATGPTGAPAITTRYAARTGSDSNPGTQSQPFLTANKLFNSLGPGDTGIMRAGVYDEHISGGRFAVYMPTAGSAAKADGITVKAYPGETVQIVGPAKISRHWVRMEGIKINSRPYDDARDECWWSDGNDHYFLNCDFTNNYGDGSYYDSKGSAAFVTGDRCTYDHCSFHNVLWDQAAGTNQPHGIYAVDTDGLVVTNCKFWNIGSGPVNGQFGVQLYPSGTHALIQNNVFDNVNSAVVFGDVTNSIVEKNVISNTGYFQNGVYVLGAGAANVVRDNHSWKLGVTPLSGGPGTGTSESGTTSGDPIYTNAAGHVYTPMSGTGTAGKGPDPAPVVVPPPSGVLRAHFTDFGSSWGSSAADHSGQIFQNRANLGVNFGLQTLGDPQTPWPSINGLAITEVTDDLGNPGFRFRCNQEMLASSGGKKTEIYQNESSTYIPNIVRGVGFTDEVAFYIRFPAAGNPNGFSGNTNSWNVFWQHDTSKISGFGIDMQTSDDPPRFYCGLGSSQVGPWRVLLPWKVQFDVTYHFRFEVFWSTTATGTWKWWVKRPSDPAEVQYMNYTGITCFGAKPNTEFGFYGDPTAGKNTEVIISDIRVTHH